MADNEPRSREDEYFWRRDQELIEKMRRGALAEQATREMGTKVGLNDPEMFQELAALGFTIDTVDLLPLMPLIQVAWAEGGVNIGTNTEPKSFKFFSRFIADSFVLYAS